MSLPPPLPETIPPAHKPLNTGLKTSFFVIGLLQLGLAITLMTFASDGKSSARAFGALLGSTFFLPAVIAGCFAIGRDFRNLRSLAIVTTIVWSIASIGHLARIGRDRPVRHVSGAELGRFVDQVRAKAASGSDSAEPDESAEATGSEPAQEPLATVESEVAVDLSPGSDERLIAVIDSAREARYVEIVTAYARACAQRPADAVLALERVKFIEYFVWSEDFTIERAESDHADALAHLTGRFPHEPGTVLYLLRNAYDPGFQTLDARHAVRTDDWTDAERAQLFLLRARAADAREEPKRVLHWARKSFETTPSAAAGVLLAEQLKAGGDAKACAVVLADPCFEAAEPWLRKQQMNLLLDVGETGLALAAHASLPAEYLNDAETAMRLARGGHIEVARVIIEAIPSHEWNKARVARDRFEFALQYDTADQVLTAYRAMREEGAGLEPFFRDRFAVLVAHPGLAWSLDDVGLFLLFLLLLSAMMVAPGLLFAPVHYWSLLRGRSDAWPASHWGLRAAWIVCAMMLVADTIAVWYLMPESLRIFDDALLSGGEAETAPILPAQTIVWGSATAILLASMIRARAWRLLGPGSWSLGQSIGYAAGLVLLARFALRTGAVVWPEVFSEYVLGAFSDQLAISRELVAAGGALTLIAVLGLAVPVIEEVLFRGVLLPAIATHISFGWANALQAALFASIHMSWGLFPFFFAFGVITGALVRRSGGLLPAILFHVFNNVLACLGMLTLLRLKG